MTIPETVKDLNERKEALYKFLNIEGLKKEIAEEEKRTEAADFWNDPKEAQAVMKKLKAKNGKKK